MPPTTNDCGVAVSNIQLINFSYEIDYDLQNISAVDLSVTELTRVMLEANRFDFLVTIAYLDQRTAAPVLQATCLTSYALHGMQRATDPQSGKSTVQVPNALLALMRIEAAAHARALVAVQAAATPFGKIYVATPPHQPAAEAAARP